MTFLFVSYLDPILMSDNFHHKVSGAQTTVNVVYAERF